jgi:ABC-type glycerol-3-phosphate transport system permease component
VNRRSLRRTVPRVILYIVLSFGAVVMFFPVAWTVSASLKPNAEVLLVPVRWIPSEIHWGNFVRPFIEKPFGRYFLNSVVVSASVTVLNLFFCALAGYGFAKFKFRGRNILFLYVLSTLMVPLHVIMISLFLVVKSFGWLNTYQSLIVPAMISAFGVFLMRQFMVSIPSEYIDSARIDGEHEFGIFLRVILPMVTPPVATLGIYIFMGSWDDFLWPLIVISMDKLKTIPLGIASFESIYRSSYNYLMAISLLALIPILLAFVFFQRKIIQSVVMSGLKQ